MNRSFGLSGDLGTPLMVAALLVALLGLVLLAVEIRRRGDGAALIATSGVLATLLAVIALLRPVTVLSRGTMVGPKVVVLVDRSRSMLLPGDAGSRAEVADRALAELAKTKSASRLSVLGFSADRPRPFEPHSSPLGLRSDLMAGLSPAVGEADELPRAIVVVSDGRLDTPVAADAGKVVKAALDGRAIPVHTVSVARRTPRDASVRAVKAAGAAVAHQPLPMTIEVGCTGGISCDRLTVTVRELLDGGPPALLASGLAKIENGTALLDLSVTLDRAGPRLVEIAIDAPAGDEIPENNRRILAFDVGRERVRVLHVAGRPTYDVRALRTWLKSNASVDVVTFFILRSERSDVGAAESELALIRFPVHELFTDHLGSFDAVILQDFSVAHFRIGPEPAKYLVNLRDYVERGGGLVMVGGPGAFVDGGYVGTPLERVLPVDLGKRGPGDAGNDATMFVPLPTQAGRAAPMLAPLRALFGDELPSLPGTNVVDDAKPGSLTLWEHPTRKTSSGKRMPVLSLGEPGDGRAVALTVDSAHRLGFSEFAARVAGRGHGALWDGLLGWLMRDPRFEPAQVELVHPCIAGEPTSLRVTTLPQMTGGISVDVNAAGEAKGAAAVARTPTLRAEIPPGGGAVVVPVGTLAEGGYMAKVSVGGGSVTRRAFACEKGGDEWADPRPDEDRLRAIASATGGQFVRASDVGSLTFPKPAEVSAERTVSPVLPAWVWTLAAAIALGAHWIARRRGGLA